jgi:Na+/proline symporter
MSTGATIGLVIFGLAVAVVGIAAMWKVFTKAGKPGWAAIIPFYNAYTLLKVVGRPGWWLVLLFIPLVNIVIAIVVMVDLAKSFGKGGLFAFFGLIVFSFIGYCILGFGKARYLGPAGAGPSQQQYPPQQAQYQG